MLLGGLGGAGLGYSLAGKKNRLEGALAGGLSGAALGGATGAMLGRSGKTYTASTPDWARSSYSSSSSIGGGGSTSRSSPFRSTFNEAEFQARQAKLDAEIEELLRKAREESRKAREEARRRAQEQARQRARGRDPFGGGDPFGRNPFGGGRRPSPPPRPSTPPPNWAEGAATKAEAKKKYKQEAMKAHPDRGGTHEDFVKLQKEWDDFQKSREFAKLAMPFLDELAKILCCA